MIRWRMRWLDCADSAAPGSDTTEASTEGADPNQHRWFRLLVSMLGLALLAYGLVYAYFTNPTLGLVVALAGGVLLGLGGYGLWEPKPGGRPKIPASLKKTAATSRLSRRARSFQIRLYWRRVGSPAWDTSTD